MVRIALLVLSLLLLAHGGDGVYRAVRGRSQAQMTCEQFAREGTPAGLLRLTGCEVDYLNAGYREAPADLWDRLFGNQPPRSRITELLFPVRAASAPAGSPAILVVSTRDPNVLAIAERTLGARATIDQEAFLVMMLEVVTAMRVSPAIEGAVRPPLDALRSRRALAAMRTPLREDVTILDLHERPAILFPLIELGAGILGLFVALFPKPKKDLPAEAEPALEKSVTSGFSRKAVEFPRLMLVNLPPAATMADVEAAPPLGSQDDVRQRIGAAIPGLQFDADGRGRLETAAHTIAIDLGRGDPVYTAVLDLRGDALATLTALLDRTGWRAFAPKRGTFVAPSDFA